MRVSRGLRDAGRGIRGRREFTPVASEPEVGRGGTREKDRVLDSAHHGNASLHTRLPGGGSWTKSSGDASPWLAAPAASAAPVPERHPHIDEALEAMRNAKHHLESAEHDFDGHRMKAIEHLNQAIHEAEICMAMK